MTDKQNNIILARVYSDNKLIGIFPRTASHTLSLDAIISLAGSSNEITPKSQVAYIAETHNEENPFSRLLVERNHTTPLTIKTVSHPVTNLFSLVEQKEVPENAIKAAQELLEKGAIRTAEKIYDSKGNGTWTPQLYAIDSMNSLFKRDNVPMDGKYFDKVPLLTADWTLRDFKERGIRFIPNSFARAGAYIGKGTTIMPGAIVNTGAYIEGDGVMIDGGARVATGAQIGKKVKLGAGSGVEGILEPRGMIPTIVENNVRVGAQCELAGIIEEGAAIASGVVMTKQKKVFDLRTNEFQDPRVIEINGERKAFQYIPTNRIAVPGVYMKKAGEYQVGTECILLLEKDASQIDFMELPKNSALYISVK